MGFVSAADALASRACPGTAAGAAGAAAEPANRGSCRPDDYDPRFISLPVTVHDGEESDDDEKIVSFGGGGALKVKPNAERSDKPEAKTRVRPKRAAELGEHGFWAKAPKAPRRVRLKRTVKADGDVGPVAFFSTPRKLDGALCILRGVITAERGLPFSYGATFAGKWSYALEDIETACAQAFRYEVVEQTPGAFALSGTFVDNPVLLGGRRSNGELKGCLRFDDMQLQLLPNSLEVSGEGHCDFYGPYTVTGELVLNEQRTKASLRIAKLRPPTRRA